MDAILRIKEKNGNIFEFSYLKQGLSCSQVWSFIEKETTIIVYCRNIGSEKRNYPDEYLGTVTVSEYNQYLQKVGIIQEQEKNQENQENQENQTLKNWITSIQGLQYLGLVCALSGIEDKYGNWIMPYPDKICDIKQYIDENIDDAFENCE
jgi:hypothetical protein